MSSLLEYYKKNIKQFNIDEIETDMLNIIDLVSIELTQTQQISTNIDVCTVLICGYYLNNIDEECDILTDNVDLGFIIELAVNDLSKLLDFVNDKHASIFKTLSYGHYLRVVNQRYELEQMINGL